MLYRSLANASGPTASRGRPCLFTLARRVIVQRFVLLLLGVALLTVVTTGCGGGEKDKNKNSGLDRPKGAGKAEKMSKDE